MSKYIYDNYSDYFQGLYYPDGISYADETIGEDEAAVRNVTFVVTDDCQLRCTYCYEINKCHHFMSKETAKRGVDRLFELYYSDDTSFINHKTKALIIEFIGGEPFLNVDLMDYISEYFLLRAIKEHHIWAKTVRFSISSNGQAYFDTKVQDYLKKYKGYVSLGISIDGPKDIHDSCRIYENGSGSFDKAIAAFRHSTKVLGYPPQTKITLSRNNLKDVIRIVSFFVAEGCDNINMNCIYEEDWQLEDAQKFYQLLKQLADYCLLHPEIRVSIFEEDFFHPLLKTDIQCWCGGGGKMLSFDWDGTAYPCTRFCPTSLGNSIPSLPMGNVSNVFSSVESKEVLSKLKTLNRRSKSTDECFNCQIAAGCSDCEAWNYQQAGGKLGIRSTNICWMHKARSLANVYYWNKYYIGNNIKKKFKMYLNEEDAIQICGSVDEYKELVNISKEE